MAKVAVHKVTKVKNAKKKFQNVSNIYCFKSKLF